MTDEEGTFPGCVRSVGDCCDLIPARSTAEGGIACADVFPAAADRADGVAVSRYEPGSRKSARMTVVAKDTRRTRASWSGSIIWTRSGALPSRHDVKCARLEVDLRPVRSARARLTGRMPCLRQGCTRPWCCDRQGRHGCRADHGRRALNPFRRRPHVTPSMDGRLSADGIPESSWTTDDAAQGDLECRRGSRKAMSATPG